ncbi:MAG: hypothetical protein ACK4WM_10005 [Thermoflexales bacterium]
MKQRTAFLIASGLTAFLLVGVGMLAGRLDLSNNGAASPTETVESAAEALPAQPDLSPAAEQMPGASGPSRPATTPQLPTTAGLPPLPSAATKPAVQAMETRPPAATDAPPPTPTADAIAVLTEREAQYRALLEEANRRLEEANQQLAKLEQQLEAVQATQSAPAPVANASRSQATQRPRVQPAPAQPQPVIQAALTPQRALEIALITAPGTVAQRMPELVDFQGVVAYEVLLNAGTMYVDANSGAILYNGVVVQPPPPPQSPPVYYDDDDDDDDHEKHEKKEKKHKD